MLRLLVPAEEADTGTLELLGRCFAPRDFDVGEAAPPYTCVSYAWGLGRSPIPHDPGRMMSDRTLGALRA